MTHIHRRGLDREYKNIKSIEYKQKQIEVQIQVLQKKHQELEGKKEDRTNALTIKGLQYYNPDKRQVLLNKAETLCYSKSTIESLRKIGEDEWNLDSVAAPEIEVFMTIEDYVNDNTPFWKKPLAKIGEAFLGGGNETNED